MDEVEGEASAKSTRIASVLACRSTAAASPMGLEVPCDRWARSSSRDLPSAPPTSPRSMGRGSRLPARRAGRRLRSSQREGSTTWACESPSTPTSVSTRRRRLSVEMTFEHEGKGVAPLVAAGDCRIVLNQDVGKPGWDRIKGQGFSLQINVATPADVAAAGARIRRRAGRSRMSRVITPGGRGCSSSTIRMGSGSASPPRSRRKARAIAGASRCARWLARLNAVWPAPQSCVGAPCRRSAPRAEAPHRHGAVCGAPGGRSRPRRMPPPSRRRASTSPPSGVPFPR